MPKSDERAFLDRGVRKLRALRKQHGFEYEPGEYSTARSFATGFFRRGKLEIGLIVRSKDRLGCPNYSEGHGYAGHEDLFWALGQEGEAWLREGEFLSYHARDGGDPFRALKHDLEAVILPALEDSPKDFSKALARAHRKFQDSLSGRLAKAQANEGKRKPKRSRPRKVKERRGS